GAGDPAVGDVASRARVGTRTGTWGVLRPNTWPVGERGRHGTGCTGTGEHGGGGAMNTDLIDRVRNRLAATGATVDAAAVADAVRAESGGVAGHADVLQAVRQLRREFVGAGPLEPLLDDPGTTDVLV